MANESFRFNLPPGRIVSGSPTYKQEKDPQGNLKKTPSWFMAVAVPKTTPGVMDVINLVVNTARQGYQSNQLIAQRVAAGLKGGFRWKIDDGDDPEDPKHRNREGYAGCWIFKFNTSIGAMKCCDQNGNQIDGALIKTGHWVDVQGSVEINGNTDATAGVYLNPGWVRFQWYGPEIQAGPTPEQAFQGAPSSYAMPAGASATPLVGGAPGAGAGPGFSGGTSFQPQPQAQIGFGGGPAPAANGFGGGPAPSAGPGFGGAQPQPQPGFNPNTQPAVAQGGPTAAEIAAHYRVQHHPGWRWNPATNSYDPDQPNPQPQTHAGGPAAQGGGFGGPAPSGAPGFSQGTASRSDPYPGAQPHTGFVTGQR